MRLVLIEGMETPSDYQTRASVVFMRVGMMFQSVLTKHIAV